MYKASKIWNLIQNLWFTCKVFYNCKVLFLKASSFNWFHTSIKKYMWTNTLHILLQKLFIISFHDTLTYRFIHISTIRTLNFRIKYPMCKSYSTIKLCPYHFAVGNYPTFYQRNTKLIIKMYEFFRCNIVVYTVIKCMCSYILDTSLIIKGILVSSKFLYLSNLSIIEW